MESEPSYSGDSDSASGSSSGSSDTEEETLEPVNILGHCLELPQELCEDFRLFKEFFSMKTWQALDEKHKEHLKTFLPKFDDNEEEERQKTINMFFSRETFHFSSPLKQFFHNLKQGNFRPDIAKMKKFLTKARSKQQKHKVKSYYGKLLPDVLLSRERLLAAAKAAPPGPLPRLPPLPPKTSSNRQIKSPHVRARQRYFEELVAIRSEVGGDESEDDNYPEGVPPTVNRRRKAPQPTQNSEDNVYSTLGPNDPSRRNQLLCLKTVLNTHKIRRQYKESHPELNTTGITLEEIKQRSSLLNGTRRLMFGSQKTSQESPIQKLKRGNKKETPSKSKNIDAKPPKIAKIKEQDHTSDGTENKRKKKLEEETDSESSSFVEPAPSPKQLKRLHSINEKNDIQQEVYESKYADDPSFVNSVNYMGSNADSVIKIKQEPMDIVPSALPQSRLSQLVPIKSEDLDGIDMMTLPVELADDCDEVMETDAPTDSAFQEEAMLVDADESLMETTYANFLSLVRALFPARTAHRASRQELHTRCSALMRSPIAPLNTWYNLSNDWCAELDSALDFLAGEKGPHPDDFVPYLQFMPDSQMYQWIGAGRDCDANLGRLCERWLSAPAALAASADPAGPPPPPPPPPRYPTSWIVQPPTSAELAEFRAQERRRFASAAKPFTYVQHGYRAAVGGCTRGAAACAAQALLVGERPRHACFAALVRDAVARLPNGQGTKHHILTLLKMSQWIVPCSDQVLSSALSSTLERLHTAKRDPIVKLDPRTATWIYLYRHRTEEDWSKPSTGRSRKPLPLPAPPPTLSMEMEVGNIEEALDYGSDSDVDVEDSGLSPTASHLSSAQLLIQATQAKIHSTPSTPTHKLKTKASETPKSKHGPIVIAPPKSSPSAVKPKSKSVLSQQIQPPPQKVVKSNPVVTQVPKSSPSVVTKSPLIKQRPLQKTEQPNKAIPVVVASTAAPVVSSVLHTVTTPQSQVNKTPTAGTRSLLLRPTISTAGATSAAAAQMGPRRGVVRVLSPAAPAAGKSLISPKALLPLSAVSAPGNQTSNITKKRLSLQTSSSVTTIAQTTSAATSMVSSAATAVTSSVQNVPTRTVQLAGGRTVQLANQTVHLPSGQTVQLPSGQTVQLSSGQTVQLPSGQAVQLSSGHTLQLSSLQLPTHTVRLPSGQTVQLATSQSGRVVAAPIKTITQQSTATTKSTTSQIQVPVSTVQLAGQTVQIAGQSVQLTGHTVKLPSGQSVQVATSSVQIPSAQNVQTLQLPSGQNVQTVQLSGQNVQLSGQSVQLGSQTVQLAGQTVQLAGGQTVQLPSGQTLQLPSGQTVQLSSGQTIQLSNGQTVQLAGQIQTSKPVVQHVVRAQNTGDKTTTSPLVTKLLTNAQGQMISLEGVVGGTRTLQLAGMRQQAPKTLQAVQGVRVVGTGTRARPLLLTAAKPLHNIILQQSDGTSVRVTSSGGVTPTQTIVLSNLGGQSVASGGTAPVLKLQQVNPIQHVKLSQGIKLQQAANNITASSSASSSNTVRSVIMDSQQFGQQLKIVGGKHVLAKILRPAQPP